MPFVPHVVVTKAQQAQGTGLAASLKKVRGAPAQLQLTFRVKVVIDLNRENSDWDDKAKCEVMIGEDESRGLLRLRPSPAGTAQLLLRQAGGAGKRGGPYYALNLGHVPAFPDRSEEKRWVKFEQVEDNWLEVVLPGWADAPRPTPPAAVAPRPVSPAVALAVARNAGRDVTSQMMGDPPANRSALAQIAAPTRGAARRAAEEREAPELAAVESAAAERAINDVDALSQLMTSFGLTALEARYLAVLLDGRVASRERLTSQCHEANEDIDPKTADVVVFRLRSKLKTRLVMIETIRSQGYRIDANGIARVRQLISETSDRGAA
jgi:hypothetical protein